MLVGSVQYEKVGMDSGSGARQNSWRCSSGSTPSAPSPNVASGEDGSRDDGSSGGRIRATAAQLLPPRPLLGPDPAALNDSVSTWKRRRQEDNNRCEVDPVREEHPPRALGAQQRWMSMPGGSRRSPPPCHGAVAASISTVPTTVLLTRLRGGSRRPLPRCGRVIRLHGVGSGAPHMPAVTTRLLVAYDGFGS